MKSRILLILTAMLLSWYSWAQDTQDSTAEPALTQDASETGDAQEEVGNEAEVSSDEEANQEEEEDAPGRFIPSEEISQDLGVSFPIDI